MMVFARLGKFHQAGIAIGFSLVVMLAAVMTLTPALLRLARRGARWPHRQAVTVPSSAPGRSARSRATRIQIVWEQIAAGVLRRPGTLWLVTTALLTPLAVIGIVWYNHLDYDLVANLLPS